MEESLLVLIVDTRIQEPVLDWLLDYREDILFTSGRVDCHGVEHAALSDREQVSGSTPRLMVQLQVPLAEARRICAGLGAALPKAGIRYWIVPLLEQGLLGPSAGP
ncbi:MAG: DUF3240 family protein [Burkholderiales bacterium]|nr:DUF3240 family protein [Burkholderiales bacterium]